jgi:integrase
LGAIVLTENKFLTDNETEHLLALLKRSKGERDSIMLRIALYTGARGCELLKLTAKDFSKEGNVSIRGAKGSNDRTVPLNVEDYLFSKEVAKYIEENQLKADDRLFPISTRRLRYIWDFWRSNPNKGIHAIRHTTGLLMYLNSSDINKVKSLLGHRQINNSQIYAEFTHGPRTLKKSMKGMFKKKISDERE